MDKSPSDSSRDLQAFYFSDFANAYIPHILKEIYIDSIYRPFVIGKRDMVIMDVGANIGLTSFYFKDFAKLVIAVEPALQHRQAFEAMLTQNKITNVKLLPYAVSNADGKMNLNHHPNTTEFTLEGIINDKYGFEEVETVTFGTLCKRADITAIDFLKLDVEGHEGKIVCSDSFKEAAAQIKGMVVEWHEWSGMSMANLEHAIQDLGFYTHRLPSIAHTIAAIHI